jgi:hypothetical protein
MNYIVLEKKCRQAINNNFKKMVMSKYTKNIKNEEKKKKKKNFK